MTKVFAILTKAAASVRRIRGILHLPPQFLIHGYGMSAQKQPRPQMTLGLARRTGSAKTLTRAW